MPGCYGRRMVGMGMAELLLLLMMTGGGLPSQIAFGNPAIWLAQSVVTKSVPAAAGVWLFAEDLSLAGPPAATSPPPVQIVPPSKSP